MYCLCGTLCPVPVCVYISGWSTRSISHLGVNTLTTPPTHPFLSFSLSFLNFSFMFNCSYDSMNNSLCLSSQLPFVPGIRLEAVTWPLNKLEGHVVELDETYGMGIWREEYFFWFSNLTLNMSVCLSEPQFPLLKGGWMIDI